MKKIKLGVMKTYSEVAKGGQGCCGPAGPRYAHEEKIGYDPKDLKKIPESAVLGVGCGNPVAVASLKKGEVVLDLGSGAGIDVFLAADKVGSTGRVIGVDMTPEMIERARDNAEKGGFKNVEFRLGEIENLPVDDGTIDCVISNCVINLSVDKDKTFAEAYRVLRPGGRLMVSDIVLTKELPREITDNAEAYSACIAGAVMLDGYLDSIRRAGFLEAKVLSSTDASFLAEAACSCGTLIMDNISDLGLRSIKVLALKP
jgi:arsenite methyltransferase